MVIEINVLCCVMFVGYFIHKGKNSVLIKVNSKISSNSVEPGFYPYGISFSEAGEVY